MGKCQLAKPSEISRGPSETKMDDPKELYAPSSWLPCHPRWSSTLTYSGGQSPPLWAEREMGKARSKALYFCTPLQLLKVLLYFEHGDIWHPKIPKCVTFIFGDSAEESQKAWMAELQRQVAVQMLHFLGRGCTKDLYRDNGGCSAAGEMARRYGQIC